MTEPKKRYKVADIAVDEDGVIWFNYIGTHPDQGGLSYRWGSVGLYDAKSVASYAEHVFIAELPTWLEQIKKKAADPKGS